jgi:GWxTD domain-containing protein
MAGPTQRNSLYNLNAEGQVRNRRFNSLTPSLAALLLACAMLTFSHDLPAQSPSAGQKFIAGDSAPTPLAGPYRTWLDQDVSWIISDDERSAYTALQTNPERLTFITGFWARRNPDPGSSENKFKEEHYRRLAYANVHFATSHPGWMSDRGRVYIVYGKPDSIDAYPSGGSSGSNPFEVWHYKLIRVPNEAPQPGWIMTAMDFKFVDTCHCGDYKLTSPLP